MPLTAAQRTAFFEECSKKMRLKWAFSPCDGVQLQQEGIDNVDDPVDFDKDTVEQIAANLRRPAGRMLDPNPAAAASAAIPTPPFAFGAKSQRRLIHAAKLVRHQAIGVRTIPLACVIRQAPKEPQGTPHSAEYKLIETGHPLFREDNSSACHKLEEATRAASHATSIEPFQRPRMGETLGLPCLTMLETTNGKLRSRDMSNCCVQDCGSARATSPLRGSLLNVEMPSSPCKLLLGM
jgi:hypothetical protein